MRIVRWALFSFLPGLEGSPSVRVPPENQWSAEAVGRDDGGHTLWVYKGGTVTEQRELWRKYAAWPFLIGVPFFLFILWKPLFILDPTNIA